MNNNQNISKKNKIENNFGFFPRLLVISGPSGAGKSTLCAKLLKERPNIKYSISCTTRNPRESEEDGLDYFFITRKQFKISIKKKEFLEFAKVHDNFYGTLEDSVLSSLRKGFHVIMDIDVQGAKKIRAKIKNMSSENLIARGYIDIFINPSKFEDLEKRLLIRNTDNIQVIKKRLKVAKKELSQASLYAYQIINDDIEKAYVDLCRIIDDLE